MSHQKISETGNKTKKPDNKPTFWEWLVHGKGTVSEPWPTAEEVLANPEVKQEIQTVQETFEKYKKAKKNNSKTKNKIIINIEFS